MRMFWKRLLYYELIRTAFSLGGSEFEPEGFSDFAKVNPWLNDICYVNKKPVITAKSDADVFGEFMTKIVAPILITGSLNCNDNTVVMIGESKVNIDEGTMVEEGQYSEACAFCRCGSDGRYVATAICSKQLFDATGLVGNDNLTKFYLMQEYLDLPSKYRRAIQCTIYDPKTILLFLSYLAGKVAVGDDCSDNSAIGVAANTFRKIVAARIGCGALPSNAVVNELVDLLEIRNDLVPVEGRWPFNKLLRFLALIAIVNGIFPLSKEQSLGDVLVENLPFVFAGTAAKVLPYIAGERYSDIMEAVLNDSASRPNEITTAEELLFESLVAAPASPAFLRKALDVLFSKSIAYGHTLSMKDLLSGPNGGETRKYLNERFKTAFLDGRLEYHFAAGAILMADLKSSLEETTRFALAAKDDIDAVLGITAAGLIVWLEGGSVPNPNAVPISFIHLLKEHLKRPDARYFYPTAATVHDLIVNVRMSKHMILSEEILKTSIELLGESFGVRNWAEYILALMPISHTYCGGREWVPFYRERLERELNNTDSFACPEVTLGVLSHIGDYDRNTLYQMYDRVERYYATPRHIGTPEQLKRKIILERNIFGKSALGCKPRMEGM